MNIVKYIMSNRVIIISIVSAAAMIVRWQCDRIYFYIILAFSQRMPKIYISVPRVQDTAQITWPKGERLMEIYDIGNLVNTINDSEYKKSLHIMILGSSGFQASPFEGYPEEKVDENSKTLGLSSIQPGLRFSGSGICTTSFRNVQFMRSFEA